MKVSTVEPGATPGTALQKPHLGMPQWAHIGTGDTGHRGSRGQGNAHKGEI